MKKKKRLSIYKSKRFFSNVFHSYIIACLLNIIFPWIWIYKAWTVSHSAKRYPIYLQSQSPQHILRNLAGVSLKPGNFWKPILLFQLLCLCKGGKLNLLVSAAPPGPEYWSLDARTLRDGHIHLFWSWMVHLAHTHASSLSSHQDVPGSGKDAESQTHTQSQEDTIGYCNHEWPKPTLPLILSNLIRIRTSKFRKKGDRGHDITWFKIMTDGRNGRYR